MLNFKIKPIHMILTTALVVVSFGKTNVNAEVKLDDVVNSSTVMGHITENHEATNESIVINVSDSINLEATKTEFLSRSTEYKKHSIDMKQFNKDVSGLTLTIDYINFSSLDEQIVTVKFAIESTTLLNIKRKLEFKEEFVITIDSDSVPTINLSDTDVSLYVGDDFDPNDYIESYTSTVGLDVASLQIDNPVDVNTVGDYQVSYSVTNKFGNTGTSTLNVTVEEKPAPVVSYSYSGSYSSGESYTSDSIYAMLALVNEKRASLGIGPVYLADSRVMAAANVRAIEANSYVSHYRPNGTYYTTALREQGVSFFASEILTYAGSTVADKFNWWMSSSSHRNILLNPNFSYAAFGYYNGMWAGLLY